MVATMKIRNPKSEIRMYTAKTAKSDLRSVLEQVERENSDFWIWRDLPSTNSVLRDGPSPNATPKNLMERVAQFGERIIRFVKKIPRGYSHPENVRLIDQLVGASTGIGANYCEADDSVSGKDFKHKIAICRKESKETMFFLRMVAASEESLANEAREHWREAKELNLIFGSIWRKS
jgi:four helix bundle protein